MDKDISKDNVKLIELILKVESLLQRNLNSHNQGHLVMDNISPLKPAVEKVLELIQFNVILTNNNEIKVR